VSSVRGEREVGSSSRVDVEPAACCHTHRERTMRILPPDVVVTFLAYSQHDYDGAFLNVVFPTFKWDDNVKPLTPLLHIEEVGTQLKLREQGLYGEELRRLVRQQHTVVCVTLCVLEANEDAITAHRHMGFELAASSANGTEAEHLFTLSGEKLSALRNAPARKLGTEAARCRFVHNPVLYTSLAMRTACTSSSADDDVVDVVPSRHRAMLLQVGQPIVCCGRKGEDIQITGNGRTEGRWEGCVEVRVVMRVAPTSALTWRGLRHRCIRSAWRATRSGTRMKPTRWRYTR
jgi:hypothetical protein